MTIVEILLLCKVVDNYGDIGFVYRLARALSDVDGSLRIALAVSDLASFSYMAPGLDVSKSFQRYCGWDVLDWNDAGTCACWCRSHGIRLVIECFQCGRPDWLENYLFGGGLPDGATARIINLEYLTAEDWAEDFHLLKSGTRSLSVKKVNFMPGFTSGTGGLLLDAGFMSLLADRDACRDVARRKLCACSGQSAVRGEFIDSDACNVLVFSYERDFAPVVSAFQRYHEEGGRLSVCLAQGRGADSFVSAYGDAGCDFPFMKLPPLEQESWDALLVSCDIAFVRGEESFSRSCLASRPFVWHAYRQDKGFHLVKVAALLKRMRPFFAPEDFSLLSEFFLLYNMDCAMELGAEAVEGVEEICDGFLSRQAEGNFCEHELDRRESELALAFLKARERLSAAFSAFSASLVCNGDLAAHLLDFLKENFI